MPHATLYWYPGNGLLSDCVRPLSEPVKMHHQWSPMEFTWGQFPWWCHQMETFFPRYWPFMQGIHRSLVNSPHKGQWRGALMFSLTCTWISSWVNDREAGDLRCHCAHYDVIVMQWEWPSISVAIVYLKMTYFNLQLHLPGVKELIGLLLPLFFGGHVP